MTESQLLMTVEKIKKYIDKTGKSAEIHIIGGEPTMLGLPFYNSVMPKIREILKDNEYSLVLVSNLLSDDILEIAKKFDVVSTSYEPETRFLKEATKTRWEKSVSCLVDKGINLGATVAMTKQTINHGAENVIRYLIEDLSIKNIHFGFFIPEGDGLVNISETMPPFEMTSNFLIEVSKIYIDRYRGNGIYINPVESMIASLHKNVAMNDIVCPIINGSIDINWDGNCNSCLEAGGSLNPQYSGNIYKNEIIEIVEHKNFKKEILFAKRPKKVCFDCEYQSICKGACSVLFKYYDDSSEDCPGFKRWISFLHGKNIQV